MARLTQDQFNFLNKEYGLFNNTHEYCLSEKSIKTRPLSYYFWGVCYLADRVTDNLNFQELCFILMTSHFKYYEEHILGDVTGWSHEKNKRVLTSLISKGYVKKEIPPNRQSLYKRTFYKVAYKYYPTKKADALLKKIEDGFNRLLNKLDEDAEGLSKKPKPLKGTPTPKSP